MARNLVHWIGVAGLIGMVASGCSREEPTFHEAGSLNALRIGVSIPAATHGWLAGAGWWAEQAIAAHPEIRWKLKRAPLASDQADQVEAMLEDGIDALVILPFDSDTPLPVVRRARQRGVYVVSVDHRLREPIADLHVAGDNPTFGRTSAEYIAGRLGGKGRIVILRGLSAEADRERHEGAMKVFGGHPGIQILGAQPGNGNRQDAHRVMQGFLTQFDAIDAVWAGDDDMALGVEQALQEAGRLGGMWILGGAGMKDIVKRVMDRDALYPADVAYSPAVIAAGIHLAVAGLRNGDERAVADLIPAHLCIPAARLLPARDPTWKGRQRPFVIDATLITPENAADFYFPDSAY
jgi:ribose transport system substrate-binding protein